MTKDILSFLNKNDIKQLENFVSQPKEHIENFVKTFEQSVKQNGPDSFIPMVTIFRNPQTVEITIVCNSFSDKDQMYKSFAEMLYYFSASKAHSFIFAVDVRQTFYSNDDVKDKIQNPVEALTLSFVSEDSSGVLSMPYTIKEKEVNWKYEDFNLTKVADKDPSEVYQGDMAELLYVMTHMDGPLFTPAQLLNYYSYKNYMFTISNESKTANIVQLKI